MRVALVVLAALFPLCAGAGAQSPTLFGTVGPGASIRLVDGAGAVVTHLDPGTYTIQIKDQSAEHNFHLAGPGVDEATDIEEVGTFTRTVTFSDGNYGYRCDAHPTTMTGGFTVGSAPPPPTTTTPLPPAPRPAALRAVVGAGKIAVTRAGAKVVSVKAGAAVITVRDLSATDNFHLVGPGVNKATTRAGKATATWRVTLKKGVYRYRSDATPRLSGSFRAT